MCFEKKKIIKLNTNSFGPLGCWSPLRILLGKPLLCPVCVEAKPVYGEHVPGAGGGLGEDLGHGDQQEDQGEARPGHGGSLVSH